MIDAERIRTMLAARGIEVAVWREDQLRELARSLGAGRALDYLRNCVPQETVQVSGVRLLSARGIFDESFFGAAPGSYLLPFGYLVLATSVGGNAICLDVSDGSVHWADHSGFFDDQVSFEDEKTGEWHDLPLDRQSVRRALKPLAAGIEDFMAQLLDDVLTDRLNTLDLE